MVKEIIKDVDILSQKSEKFLICEDDELIRDLIDTANSHRDICAGLAAIQIGVPKRVIVVRQTDKFVPFINPIVVRRSNKKFLSVEGCLSIEGQRQVERYEWIKVMYEDINGKHRCSRFNGLIGQIIQHEIDHCNGILI